MPEYIVTKQGPKLLPADLSGDALEAAAAAILADHGGPPDPPAPPVAPASEPEPSDLDEEE